MSETTIHDSDHRQRGSLVASAGRRPDPVRSCAPGIAACMTASALLLRRGRSGDHLVLTTYGRSSGFCIDPIEKKPLNHFHPGTSVFSFGTAAAIWAASSARTGTFPSPRRWTCWPTRHRRRRSPRWRSRWTAQRGLHLQRPGHLRRVRDRHRLAARALGLASVAVTAGYINPETAAGVLCGDGRRQRRPEVLPRDFYRKITGAHLQTVLDTLVYLKSTDVWLEITTLLIPGHNDSDAELTDLCRWVARELGPTCRCISRRSIPTSRCSMLPRTPLATLIRARTIAMDAACTTSTPATSSTARETPRCAPRARPGDRARLVRPVGYRLTRDGRCAKCGTPIPGHFDPSPATSVPAGCPFRMSA